MKDPDTESFEAEKSNIAVYFIVGFIGLFGASMLIGFFDSLSNIDGDAIFLLVLGSACIAFAILLWRYFRNAPFELTKRELRIRNLFGVKTYPYKDITALGTYRKVFRPKNAKGRSMPPITISQLAITQRNGKKKVHTLPSFTANQNLLTSLSQRSQITIDKLPDEIEKGLEDHSR